MSLVLAKTSPAAPALTQQVGQLYEQHHGWLLGWLRRKLLGDAHQAADLAQDTFVRLLVAPVAPVALPGLREPRAYLTTVASRLLLNHYRRLSLEQAWLAALARSPEPLVASPEQRLALLQSLQAIDAMLDALPAKVRSAFLLSQLEGLSYAEIAVQLGVTLRSVKRYMAQAFEECLMLAQ